jgi:hypothetical protein
MRTNSTARLRATMLCAALVTVALTALPGFATAADSEDSPTVCISPVMGPGYHIDVDTRLALDRMALFPFIDTENTNRSLGPCWGGQTDAPDGGDTNVSDRADPRVH